jgi:hypothetical protein
MPKGGVPKVARRLAANGDRYTHPYLYMVLKGERYNATVIAEMIAFVEEHESEARTLNARAAGQPA